MWLLLLLLIIIIIYGYTVSGSQDNINIYIKKTKFGDTIGTVGYIFNLYKNQEYMYKHLYSYLLRDFLLNDIKPIEYYTDAEILEKYKISAINFNIEFYINWINKIFDIYTKNKYMLTTTPNDFKLCPYIMPKRKLLDKNASKQIIIKNIAMNWILNEISPGNQWSLVSDAQINKLYELGFNIECFGSAYNTRLPWFGSISELDEPWGRIGTYTEIFNTLIQKKTLKWKNIEIYKPEDTIRITTNPPSMVCDMGFLNLLNTLLEIRTGTIYIDISNRNLEVVNEFKKSPWYCSSRLLETGYSLWDGKTRNMKGREWINIIFSNEKVDYNIFMV